MDYAAWFLHKFGSAFPLAREMARVGDDFFASIEHPALTQNELMLPSFPPEPSAYCVSGCWGYGTTRQAFYFTERFDVGELGRFEVYFRVPFGNPMGVDIDVPAFMRGYTKWLETVNPKYGRISYSMGNGTYAVDGRESRIPLSDTGAVLDADAMWNRLLLGL